MGGMGLPPTGSIQIATVDALAVLFGCTHCGDAMIASVGCSGRPARIASSLPSGDQLAAVTRPIRPVPSTPPLSEADESHNSTVNAPLGPGVLKLVASNPFAE